MKWVKLHNKKRLNNYRTAGTDLKTETTHPLHDADLIFVHVYMIIMAALCS